MPRFTDLAGCSNLNVTKGIPRLKELLNCTSKIKTPYVRFKLLNHKCKLNKFKEVLLETFLIGYELLYDGRKIESISWVQRFRFFYFEKNVTIPFTSKNWIHFTFSNDCTISMISISRILQDLLPEAIILCTHSSDSTNELYILLSVNDDLWTSHDFNFNMAAMKNIHLDGIIGVHEIIEENDEIIIPDFLLTTDSIETFTEDVDLTTLRSNDISNTYLIYGIEAARSVLYSEMKGVLNNDGAYVNPRHISIICDSITKGGYLRPFSRHGLFKDKRSTLSNASFEMCTATFNNGAVARNVDNLKGVSEQIVLGMCHTFGTGSMELLLDEQMLESLDVPVNEKVFNDSVIVSNVKERYVPSSPAYSPMFSPMFPTGSETPRQYSPINDARFSPSPTYEPASPIYAPATPTYAPENDWLEDALLQEAFAQ